MHEVEILRGYGAPGAIDKNVGQAALIEALKARIQMARSGQKEAAE